MGNQLILPRVVAQIFVNLDSTDRGSAFTIFKGYTISLVFFYAWSRSEQRMVAHKRRLHD